MYIIASQDCLGPGVSSLALIFPPPIPGASRRLTTGILLPLPTTFFFNARQVDTILLCFSFSSDHRIAAIVLAPPLLSLFGRTCTQPGTINISSNRAFSPFSGPFFMNLAGRLYQGFLKHFPSAPTFLRKTRIFSLRFLKVLRRLYPEPFLLRKPAGLPSAFMSCHRCARMANHFQA